MSMTFLVPLCFTCDFTFLTTGKRKKFDFKNLPDIKYKLISVSGEEMNHHDAQFSGQIILISCGKCGEQRSIELDKEGNQLYCRRHS